ncbi:MAG: uncharacterized protein KVP18_003868 [Porospora cf. gigantea A]|uniref:uncharacterized protein n=1 Tax=Porospora cf. gigantea A TaxID=2853593 RepID=UPI003559C172|nr:MAG: hypothetical protein KVP18_003868 [Porospora cf. gigantea A]
MGNTINRLVFRPPKPSTYSASGFLQWTVSRLGDELPFIFVDNRETHTLLFFHCNAEDIGMVASTFIQRTRLWKVNLMLIEYPGYGLATGEPSEEGVYAAADAAYHWLTRKQGLPASSIIVHGRSLGSGPACHLAAKYPVGGLVFQSGFMSILRVNFGVKAQFFGDLFQNHLKFPLIFCPVFFIHGIQDSTIPFDHAKILYDKHFQAGREVVRPLWVQSADHNDLEVRYAKYATCVGYFLEYIRTLEEMNCEALDDSPKHKHRNPPVGPDEYPLSPIQELRSPPRMPVRTPLQRPATPLRRPVEERRRPVTHGLPPSPLRKPARKARRAKEPPSVEHSKSPKGERKRKQRPIKSVYSFEQIGDLTKSLIELKPVVEPSTAARNESHPNVAGKGESDSIPVPLVSNAARVVSSMPDVFIPTVRPPEPELQGSRSSVMGVSYASEGASPDYDASEGASPDYDASVSSIARDSAKSAAFYTACRSANALGSPKNFYDVVKAV